MEDANLTICEALPASDRTSDCGDGTAVCGSGQSYGIMSTAQVNMHSDEVILQYSEGAPCKNDIGIRSAHLVAAAMLSSNINVSIVCSYFHFVSNLF